MSLMHTLPGSAAVASSHVRSVGQNASFTAFQRVRNPKVCRSKNISIRRVMATGEGEVVATPIEQSANNIPAVIDIEGIKKILPHRYPFLLVDRVVELDFQKSAVGYKNITMNDNFFTGHFPERAIMPGVLQVEALAQLGGICMLDPEAEAKTQFFFGGVEKCRWRKPVVPGDCLMMKVVVTKFNKRYGIVKLDAKAYVGTDLVCEAELTLAMGS